MAIELASDEDGSGVSEREALAALETFVVENEDLLLLESQIGRFNIFDALQIAKVEIRHSNFLAFLLDPAESHGQSQLFLKALLMDLLKTVDQKLRPLSPIEIDGSDLRGVTVHREWHNIDLLIKCQHPSFLVAIENKIRSTEHSGQLARYRKTIAQHYPKTRALFVFLTLDGEEASEEEWVSYRYADLYRVFSRVRNTCQQAIGDDVLVFLDHYLSLIGTHLMNNPQIDELCQRIYKNHRQALQLIFDRVGSPASRILGEIESVLREDERWYVFYRTSKFVDFVPKTWTEWLPPLGTNSKEYPQSWFVLRLEVQEHKCKLTFYAEIRKMVDPALRRAIVATLFAEGSKHGLKRVTSREPTGFYTRVSSRECVLEWGDDDEPDDATIRTAVQKRMDELCQKLSGLPAVIQKVLKDFPAESPKGSLRVTPTVGRRLSKRSSSS